MVYKSLLILLLSIYCIFFKAQNLSALFNINQTFCNCTSGDVDSESESKIKKYFGAYLQLWYIYEEVENGKYQRLTNDKAAQKASGFSIKRARLSLKELVLMEFKS